jgi:hypothetical protein
MITTILVEGVLRQDSVLQSIRSLSRLAEIGDVSIVRTEGLYEAAVLGFAPDEVYASTGVLRVAGCRQDPPEKSMHFVLELASMNDGVVKKVESEVSVDDWLIICSVFNRLKTRFFTCVERKRNAGLVWEKLGQQRTFDLTSSRKYQECLPEGDGDTEFRRFIDDSVNLLSELEINRRREDEGEPLLNVLWPWGGGVRMPLPNLALRFGLPRGVFAEEVRSLHLCGLARLAGFRPYSLSELSWHHPFAKSGLIVFDFSGLQAEALEERLDRFGSDWLEKTLDEFRSKEAIQLILMDREKGRALRWLYRGKDEGSAFPLDERSFDERKIATHSLYRVVTAG